MMTSPIGTSFQRYRNTLGSPNVLILRPTSPTPYLSHSSIILTLSSIYSLYFSPFLPTFKFYPQLNPKFSFLVSVLHNLPLYTFCKFIHYNLSFYYQFYLFLFFFFLFFSSFPVCFFLSFFLLCDFQFGLLLSFFSTKKTP